MIKPLNSPQLTATRTRTGLQHVGDLIPRLIKMYELQAELTKQEIEKEVNERIAAEELTREFEQPLVPAEALSHSLTTSVGQQATFGWDEQLRFTVSGVNHIAGNGC